MEKIVDVAQYIFYEYRRRTGEIIDEMKLHKLLYFAQRESLAITNEPLFSEGFEGWKYGPVSKEVREYYTHDGMYCKNIQPITPESIYIAKNIILQYGALSHRKLSELSCRELSWKNSRKELTDNENGNPLLLDDIRIDAQKVRPYDSLYDMYYDEFEDAEVTA